MENIVIYLGISFALAWIIGFGLSLGSICYQYLLFGNSFASKIMAFFHYVSNLFNRI